MIGSSFVYSRRRRPIIVFCSAYEVIGQRSVPLSQKCSVRAFPDMKFVPGVLIFRCKISYALVRSCYMYISSRIEKVRRLVPSHG